MKFQFVLLAAVLFCAAAIGAGPTNPAPRLKIVLVGDSTVNDQGGWGYGFKQYLTPDVECVNTAVNGRSTMSFMREGRWTNALALHGDYYFIQFGHNNQPGKPGRSTDMPTFVNDMKKYVDDARAIGAKPVLVTPLCRRGWDAENPGKIKSDLAPYAEEVRKIAAEKNVPLIDLHDRSKEYYERVGKAECDKFSPVKIAHGTNSIDNTHLKGEGRVLMAELVVGEVRKAVPELVPHLLDKPNRAAVVEESWPNGVHFDLHEADRRVDISIGGQPFTTYTWIDKLKVPTLYPIRTASGTVVTRGFPLEPRAGERVDHPHHAGWWLNYGDVNGADFWNNSITPREDRIGKLGTVRHRSVVRAADGEHRGELEVGMDWIMPDGSKILDEATTFVFHTGKNLRVVDRTTTLTALDKKVNFKDDKEGMLGLRVRRELEQPTNESVVHIEADGKAGSVKSKDTTVTGLYRNSEGKTGDDAWGARAKWTLLAGKVDGEPVTIAIFDHPSNVGYPTYWHARAYGLFAANPLGQAAFSHGKEKLNFALDPHQSVSFRYRLLIANGPITPDDIEAQYRKFLEEVK